MFRMFVKSGIVLILSTLCLLTEGLFPTGSQHEYEYRAVVRTGTLKPVHGSSDWEIQGLLRVQSQPDFVTLQLSDLTVSLFNGKPGDKPHPEQLFHSIPSQSQELLQPFTIYYDKGSVKNLSIASNEHAWAVNIKRALASILQLDEEKLIQPAFYSQENNLYGHCLAEYTVVHEDEKISVRKFIDHENCKGYPRKSWSNTAPLLCSTGRKIVTSSTVRQYELVSKEDELSLQKVVVYSGIDVQPFNAHGELGYAFVHQKLTLKTSGSIAVQIELPGEMRAVDLTFELPELDLTQGRAPAKDKLYLELVELYLKNLTDSLESNSIPKDSTLFHNEYVPHLLFVLSLVNRFNLEEFYNSVAIGTSYRQETIRNLFLKLLPQVGSEESILLIRDLVLSGKVEEKTAIELLTVVPFYIRHPTEELLKECESLLSLNDDFSDEVKHSAILTFSILVHKVCERNCQPETLEKYVRQFVDKFSGSTTYQEQMLYLEVLNNIELGNVFDYLEPIIRGNASVLASQPHHIRFLGVWASLSRAPYNPQKVFHLYWPILTNRSEHLEMRVAALTMLIVAIPTHGNFINLLWYMQTERNTHLIHYYYTTLESLVNTQYPCYTALGSLASHIIRYVRPLETRNWATGNYILDYSDSKHGFGGLAQLFAVANQRTGNPNVFYLLINNHALGRSLRKFALYLKLEGLGDAVNRMLFKSNEKSLKVSDLIHILQEIKAPTILPEKVHIEIIVKVDDRVIYFQYINHTTFYKMAEAISKMNFLAREFHVNYQTVKSPVVMESTQPTDIGVPLLLHTDSSVISSLRGNFTQDDASPSFSRINQLDIRYSFVTGSSLIVYNPILNLWHIARRSLSFQSYIPINSRLTVNPGQQQIKFSIINPAFAGISAAVHARSTAEIRGVNSEKLHDYCPTCNNVVTVTSGNTNTNTQELLNSSFPDLGTNIQAHFYDCKREYSVNDLVTLLQNVVSENNKNSRVAPISRPFLGIIYILDLLLLVPPKGSCGLRFEAVSSEPEDTEIGVSLQLIGNGSLVDSSRKYITKASINLRSSKTQSLLRAWQATATYENSNENTKHTLKMRISRSIEGKQWQKVCLDGEAIFPRPTNVLLPWKPSEDVTAKASIVWGNAEKSCPKDGTELHISARGEVTEEQEALAKNADQWPHEACLNDTQNVVEWGSGYTPITEACYRASVEVATLRKYTMSVKYNNVPEILSSTVKRVTAIIDALKPGIAQSTDESQNITTVLEIPVSSSDIILSLNHKDLVLSQAAHWFESFLINTCVDIFVPQAMNVGVLGSCVVNSARVISMDNNTHSFSASSCYTLVAGDCTPNPRFGVFVKKVPRVELLAAKVHVDYQTIEILPVSKGHLQITLNGEQIQTDKKGYRHPPAEEEYDFLVQQLEEGLVRVTSEGSHIWLQHNGHFLTLVLPSIYKGHTCGLCGDFNGDTSNDIGEKFTIPCEA